MQVDTQDYLTLCELAPNGLCFWDLETSGLGADYGDISISSFKYYGKKPFTLLATDYKNEAEFLTAICKVLANSFCWASFNGKRFDYTFLTTRLMELGLPPLEKKVHLDLYQQIRGKVRISGKSLSNLSRFFKLGESKMDLHQDVWRLKDYDQLKKRCESDVRITEELYKTIKPFILQVTR